MSSRTDPRTAAEMIGLPTPRGFPGIPEPVEELRSLLASVTALKIAVESLLRVRGEPLGISALFTGDLDALITYFDGRYAAHSRADQTWTNAAGVSVFVWVHDPETLELYLDGSRLVPVSEYTADGTTITLVTPLPGSGNVLHAVSRRNV